MSYQWLKVKKSDISFTKGFKDKHLCINKSDADSISSSYSGKNHLTTKYNFLLNSGNFKFKNNPDYKNQILLLLILYGWYYIDGDLKNSSNLPQIYQVRGAAYVNKGTLSAPEKINVKHLDSNFDISSDLQAIAWVIKSKNDVKKTMTDPGPSTVKTVYAKKKVY